MIKETTELTKSPKRNLLPWIVKLIPNDDTPARRGRPEQGAALPEPHQPFPREGEADLELHLVADEHP